MSQATTTKTITVDGRQVAIDGSERNLLEAIRASGVDLPTFCYHSELSVYGSCRLCLVEIEGKGIHSSCSITPEAGMVVKTATREIRQMRKLTLELLLANHEGSCPTCSKNNDCRLQDLAARVGVEQVRFKRTAKPMPHDRTSPSVHREPGKCILCGDCVRMCGEVQGVGAIDFANRGAGTVVQPAFGVGLGDADCVHCGQCSRVCPTGALTPASDIEAAWQALADPKTTVVAQIAPAVRVALGEEFGLPAGTQSFGQLVAALKRLGFAQVYDTSFTADLTVVEEANEFVHRLKEGGKLPMFTSCCPSWVAYAEKFNSDLLPQLSTCRSPQQMFGSLARRVLPEKLGVDGKRLVVVSLMPCTAKKFEAGRPEFSQDGQRDVDIVLTTQEVAKLIRAGGLDIRTLEPEAPDMPFGYKTGAGVLFGNSGGVTEAVLRYADAVLGDGRLRQAEFPKLHDSDGRRELTARIAGRDVRVAVVSGLGEAGRLLAEIKAGTAQYDLVEVMACPGGCIGGAGQPVSLDASVRAHRAKGIVTADRAEVLRNAADNDQVRQLYRDHLGDPGSHAAHEALHTGYHPRKRIGDLDLLLTTGEATPGREKLLVMACLGTACHLRKSQNLVNALVQAVQDRGLTSQVDVRATFCLERCGEGPNVKVGEQIVTGATLEKVMTVIGAELSRCTR